VASSAEGKPRHGSDGCAYCLVAALGAGDFKEIGQDFRSDSANLRAKLAGRIQKLQLDRRRTPSSCSKRAAATRVGPPYATETDAGEINIVDQPV
jgi:hypothetical protein